ncbi:MAG: TldD/PmbA family protein, partial [Theionarchaea archaeon]|nr:TldD/PmbA family protein [Theionarchaea archaeon]
MLDILESCFETPMARDADVIHIRQQERKVTTCSVKNGNIELFSTSYLNGVGIRVLMDHTSWGFSSTNDMETQSVMKALKNACILARTSHPTSGEDRFASLPPVRHKKSSAVEKPPSIFTDEDIAHIPLEAHEGAKETSTSIKEIMATYISIEDKKTFLSSEGSQIEQDTTRVLLYVDVLAKKGDVICPASENLGHTGGLELFDAVSPYRLGKTAGKRASRLLEAHPPPSGMFKTIIHPTLCATLLHEAIGHPLEADLAMAGGGFGAQVGNQVSSPLITIYDSGQIPGGLGYFSYDDEGVACRKTTLIEKGILTSFMHDRTSAAQSGVDPTGNAHAWDYSVEPLIRQTNIGIEPGDFTEEEMIEDIDEGLYLKGTF